MKVALGSRLPFALLVGVCVQPLPHPPGPMWLDLVLAKVEGSLPRRIPEVGNLEELLAICDSWDFVLFLLVGILVNCVTTLSCLFPKVPVWVW